MNSNFKIKRKLPNEIGIQITSLADIFIIVLIFLLKSFGSSQVKLNPSAQIVLPLAHTLPDEPVALKVEITNNALLIEDKKVCLLENFKLTEKDKQKYFQSLPIQKEFKSLKEKALFINSKNNSIKLDQSVLIIADKKTPYETIKYVLGSAAIEGFTDVKLILSRKE